MYVHGNHLVSKDDLLTEIWADAFVEENNLDKNISILRKVLGEKSGKGKFIETVRGHGFRFVAEVRKVSEVQNSIESENAIEMIEQSESETSKPEAETENNHKPNIKNKKPNRFRGLALIFLIIFTLGAIGFYLWKNSSDQISDTKIKTIAVLPFQPLVAENRNESLELGMADTLITKLSKAEKSLFAR